MVDCAILTDSNFYGPIEDIQLVLDHIITACITEVKMQRDVSSLVRTGSTGVPFRLTARLRHKRKRV
jgi:hypothetical protein